MRKNFAALWEQWKALNLKLWNQATDQVTALQTEGTIAKNAQLFMASVLGRDDVSPFCIEDVKKLNKVLTKTKYFNLEKHSLKQELQTNLESTFLNNLIIQFLTAEKTEKNGKKSHSRIGYSFNFNSLSKEDQKFLKRKDDNNILIEIKELKNLFETRNPKYKKYAIVNYGITQGEKNYILNFYVSEIEEDEDFKNQLFNAKKTDPLKQLWLSSYQPYIKENLENTKEKVKSNQIDEIKEMITKEVEEEYNLLNLTKNNKKHLKSKKSINKEAEKKEKEIKDRVEKEIRKISLTQLTLNWFEKEKGKIEDILKKVSFYYGRPKAQEARKAFLDFFISEIKNKNLYYYNSQSDKYLETFGGDFGEIDSLVRAKFVMENKKQKEIKNVEISLLGKELSDTSKQVPADGKIQFVYNNKICTCTFQSKNHAEISLKSKIYGDAHFTLGFGNNLTPNEHKTNLYAYPREALNEYGYKAVGLGLIEERGEIEKSENYLGSIPGLLRIKSFVALNDILNRSDFYYISGYYIPSCLILKLLIKFLEENEKQPIPKIESVERNGNKVIVGSLKSNWNLDSILRYFK